MYVSSIISGEKFLVDINFVRMRVSPPICSSRLLLSCRRFSPDHREKGKREGVLVILFYVVGMYGRTGSESKVAINGSGGGSSRTSASAGIRRELNRFFLSGVKWSGRPSLGVGAYGSVEPLELNGMPCAGKKIHDVLVDVGNEGADEIAGRFVEECKLMSELRHPHVVQFLGLCVSGSSTLPILVMEHLYCSLDDLLETTADIPLYMKRSIVRDVALGLAHLHGRHPAVIHRDLTARNVLLNNSMRAKLADFGVARILNLPAGKLEATLSRVPGTSTYMPPEVFSREAKYNTAVDIFSFGHLLLFTITQKQPGVEAATFVDSSGRIIARSELERREDSMTTLYGVLGRRDHPFVGIVSDCLQTNAALRPSILKVLERLEEMRSSVRDPHTRQTRLTLTQMIKKKTAENKQLLAELEAAKEDLLNAKRRIVHLTDKLQRYSHQNPTSPPNEDSLKFNHAYYNMSSLGHDGYAEVGSKGDDIDSFGKKGNSSTLRTNSHNPSPTPPAIPSSPRPSCFSPDSDQPISMIRYHSQVDSSVSPISSMAAESSPLLSLPRLGKHYLSKSHDNLASYAEISSSQTTSQKTLSGKQNSSSSSPFFAQGFSISSSESESDDFDEFEPQFLRRSPRGLTNPTNVNSLPSSTGLDSKTTNRYHTHPATSSHTATPPFYQTTKPHRRDRDPLSTTSGSSTLANTSPTYGMINTLGGSRATGPSSLPSLTNPDSIPRVSVQDSSVGNSSGGDSHSMTEPLKPLTTGMAGKIHFYTDLKPNILLLLQNTEKGKIPGVRYEPETGQVQIESDNTEKTKLASEKFRSAYVYATSNRISVTVDVPGDISESAVEEIISTQLPNFPKSAVNYNGIESSLLVLSFSGGELVRLKLALEESIQKTSSTAKPSMDTAASGIITGRTRLSITIGNLGYENADIIVFPNTSNLACKDGVAKTVDDISQGAVTQHCKSFISKHGLLGFGESIILKGGGGMKAKHVIHVNPGVGSSINYEAITRKLVVQVLKLTTNKGATSVAFCPLVANMTDANIDVVARNMLETITQFASEKKGRKLRDIRIVVREQSTFDTFHEYAKFSS